MTMAMRAKLVAYAIISRVLLLMMATVINRVVPDHHAKGVDFYALSTDRAGSETDWNYLDMPFQTFTKWDSAYFLQIAKDGYTTDKQFAFYPLYPWTINRLSTLLRHFSTISSLLPTDSRLVVSGLLVSNSAFVCCVALLPSLLNEMGIRDKQTVQMIIICFILNPATVFFMSAYSESLFALVSWAAVLCFLQGRFAAAGLLTAAGSFCRSNNVLNLVFYVSFVCQQCWTCIRSECGWKRRVHLLLYYCSVSALLVISAVAPQVFWHCYVKYSICPKLQAENACSEALLSARSVYAHVQTKYWDVGLFHYYQVKQLPNFLLAMPIVVIAIIGISYPRVDNSLYRSFAIHMLALLITLLLFSHVQISTRLLLSSSPLMYVTITSLLCSKRNWVRWLTWSYIFLYVLIGISLHVNYFPWT